jgi:hypothetical protein
MGDGERKIYLPTVKGWETAEMEKHAVREEYKPSYR